MSDANVHALPVSIPRPRTKVTVTRTCADGRHHQCQGRVYVGHSLEGGAQYEPCLCSCHEEAKAA